MEEKADNTFIYYDSFSTNENVTGFYCQFLKGATLKSDILIQLFILEVAFATFTIVPTKAESFLLFSFFLFELHLYVFSFRTRYYLYSCSARSQSACCANIGK